MNQKAGKIRKIKLQLMANSDTRKMLVRSAWNEIMLDLDGDGKADIRLSCEKGGGRVDTIGLDMTGNGEFNLYLHDVDGNGIPDTILWAEDNAEEMELVAFGSEVEEGLLSLAARLEALMNAEEFAEKELGLTLEELAAYMVANKVLLMEEIEKRANATGIERVFNYLEDAQTYYLATEEGEQPRVRPFGTALLYEDKLYIQTGRSKDVSKQIEANPHVELCAMAGGTWLRLCGELVNDDRREVKEAMLEKMPSLKAMYSADDENTQVLYFKNATATISSFTEEPEVITF